MKLKLAIAVLVAVGLLVAARAFHLHEQVRSLSRWIDGLGNWGPAVFILIYIIACVLIGDLGHLGRGDRQRTALEWTLYAVGLLAIIMVTVYITRVARKALAGRISV